MSNKVIYYWEAIGMNENWLRRGFRLLMEVRMQLAVRKLTEKGLLPADTGNSVIGFND